MESKAKHWDQMVASVRFKQTLLCQTPQHQTLINQNNVVVKQNICHCYYSRSPPPLIQWQWH